MARAGSVPADLDSWSIQNASSVLATFDSARDLTATQYICRDAEGSGCEAGALHPSACPDKCLEYVMITKTSKRC
jgi:hypothetical protein